MGIAGEVPKQKTKRVVSVSLGSSRRDTTRELSLLGYTVTVERRGCDGDLARAEAMIRDLDGSVDAIGLGGLDLYLYVGGRRYVLRDAARLARAARATPVVCGAGLKQTLERRVVANLDRRLGLGERRVLVMSAVDRFGMADAFAATGAEVVYGDLIYVLGVPVGLRSLRTVEGVAALLLPVMTQLPIGWLYPTGRAQDDEAPRLRGARYADRAEVIAGDWHFIRRYLVGGLEHKTILTNTTTPQDVAWLREQGAAALYTTTPRLGGRSLPTNLLEAALVAVAGRFPLAAAAYDELIGAAGLVGEGLELQALDSSGRSTPTRHDTARHDAGPPSPTH
ncbi:MAG: quinate 5-dehydrogenase [Trueperaceae bacterium]|nr:quinate 5-dehydrogenase [Trueperaceae bacterium]